MALALTGRLSMAEQEFDVAFKQERGAFEEAAHNLRLCRSALAKRPTTQFASLKVVPTITATIEGFYWWTKCIRTARRNTGGGAKVVLGTPIHEILSGYIAHPALYATCARSF